MTTQQICVLWSHALEYVDIDPDQLARQQCITSTLEIFRDSGKELRLYPTCSREELSNGRVVFVLKYEPQNNPNVTSDESLKFILGTSTISVRAGAWSGRARWSGDPVREESITTWLKLSNDLRKSIAHEWVTRVQREQKRFRDSLLQRSQGCEITGETTREVLEAAHILGAADGGNEATTNGILLRADLHRLWDKGLISIEPTGEVRITGDLSGYYRSLLSDKRVASSALKAVQRALAIRGRPSK